MSAVHIKGLILQFSICGPVAGWEGSGGCMGVDGRVVGGVVWELQPRVFWSLLFLGMEISFVGLFLLHTYPPAAR